MGQMMSTNDLSIRSAADSAQTVPSTARSDAAHPAMSTALADPASLPSLLHYRLTWKVVAWWTAAYGVASWLVEYGFSQLDPAGPTPFLFALNRVVYALVWGGAILVAIMSTDRLPVTSSRQVGRILAHIGICFVVTVLWGVLAYYICLLVVPGWKAEGIGKMLASTSKNVLFGYGLVVVLVHIILRVRLHRSQEVVLLRQAHQAAEAQLQVLKLEMQPHFLFNTLHAISAQIHSDPDAANDTLVLVSDMLRHAVETTRIQEVTLREELSILQLYTQIQQVRFRDRLRLTWDIENETLEAAVPHMLLQPLVENAMKHGLEAYSKAGRVIISAKRENDQLILSVRDDGPGHRHPSPRRGAGLGITNVKSRLEQLYGSNHSFMLADAPGGGTEVVIRLPFVLIARNERIEPGHASLASADTASTNGLGEIQRRGNAKRAGPGKRTAGVAKE
jgi:two-component system LytT family sensor kinase